MGNTTNAVLGDMGSTKLPKQSYNITWKAGSTQEVTWNIMANYGRGYQYRMCPAGSKLDEDCFQKTPLDFVGNQTFRWNRAGQKPRELSFKGTYATGDLVSPKGSMWAKKSGPPQRPHGLRLLRFWHWWLRPVRSLDGRRRLRRLQAAQRIPAGCAPGAPRDLLHDRRRVHRPHLRDCRQGSDSS